MSALNMGDTRVCLCADDNDSEEREKLMQKREGENWRQILEQVEEIESGVQVGRAVPLEPECSYWDRRDSV